MAEISARNVVVEFPLYGVNHRSLKTTLISAATGGRIAKALSGKSVVRALNGVSFDIVDGDRVGLLGHNGSGKSTLLRVIAGVYEPAQGVIKVKGKVASMLSVSLGMDQEASGYENIFLRGAVLGLDRREVKRLVPEICEVADLGEYIHLPVRTYSSGMSMRLAFAISTAVRADVLLMDEWLSVGDADFAKRAEQRLRSFVSEAKILVLASHSEGLLRSLCNRLIILKHGEIEAVEVIAKSCDPCL